MKSLKPLFLVLFFQFFLYPQDLEVFNYNIESGLPTNLTKSVYQDRNGYLWIGTDAGLFRFDGTNFLGFNDKLNSLFVKDIKRHDDKSFLVITDKDLLKVSHNNNSYIFENLANRNINFDLDYPKQLFPGLNNETWISGINNVFMLKDDKLKKYNVDTSFTSDNLFRSFQIFNVKNSGLYLLTLKGALYKFDEIGDRFVFQSNKLVRESIEYYSVFVLNDNSVLIGSSKGLVKLVFEKGEKLFIKNDFKLISENGKNQTDFSGFRADILNICAISVNKNGSLYLADWNRGVFELNLFSNSSHKLYGNNISSIKNLYTGDDNSLWITGDEGIFQIKRKLFKTINISKFFNDTENQYLRLLKKSDDDRIYFTDTKGLYQISYRENKINAKRLQKKEISQIYTFNIYKNVLWISYQNNKLEKLKIENPETFTTNSIYSKQINNDRVSNIFIDSKGNLWGYLERSTNLIKIDTMYREKYYKIPNTQSLRIDVIDESNKGIIYFGGTSENSILFEYDALGDKIIPVKIENFDSYKKGIIISDIDLFDENSILIASNKGLLSLKNKKTLKRIETSKEFENVPFRAICRSVGGDIFYGSDRGLLFYSNGKKAFFKKSNGLPNSTIVIDGIIVDSKGNTWVGTASGLAYRDSEKDITPVLAEPKIIAFTDKYDVNNSKVRKEIRLNRQIEASFLSLTFPSENIKYQYRILGYDSTWSDYEPHNRVTLPILPVGDYIFQVKAFSPGYIESGVSTYHFSIYAPFYLTYWAYLIYFVLGIILIVIVINMFFRYRINLYAKREQELSELVNQKTNELWLEKEKTERLLYDTEKARAELETANELKNQFLSVAAHDLKNPLNSIMCIAEILRTEAKDNDSIEMLDLMKSASERMLSLIIELLDGAALQAKAIELKRTKVNMSNLVEKISNDYKIRSSQKQQNIINNIEKDVYAIVDDFWMSAAIENIVSNAVKYSKRGGEITIGLTNYEDKIMISVHDSGPGFTSEDKEKLFGKFQRLSAKPTGGESSTGLGLSIVKDIVEKHNGKIEVDSVIGEGSVFRLII